MTEKNIFAYKLFCIKYFRFWFIFIWKLQHPQKSHPISLSNTPLKIEVLSSNPFLKIWLEVQSRPSRKGEGCTLWPPLTTPHPTHCTHTKTLLLGSGFHALKFKTLNSEYLNINHFLNKCQNNVVKIYFINKVPQRRIGIQASEHYG